MSVRPVVSGHPSAGSPREQPYIHDSSCRLNSTHRDAVAQASAGSLQGRGPASGMNRSVWTASKWKGH
ncbi:Kinesin-Like Protein Kif16B [Manis pentadactyla]|nr:Kinesin-Like Protein Kif16B [Manis pentadactyla]